MPVAVIIIAASGCFHCSFLQSNGLRKQNHVNQSLLDLPETLKLPLLQTNKYIKHEHVLAISTQNNFHLKANISYYLVSNLKTEK